MPGLKVSHREFVVTWTRSESVEDVSKTLNMNKNTVLARAVMLRKAGVRLKKFTSSKLTQLDVAQLNSLIEKTEKG